MKNTEDTKIFLVEPLSLLRDGFVSLLKSQNGLKIVGQAENGSQKTIAAIQQISPDLVILAAELNEPTSGQFIRAVKQGLPQVRFLSLASTDDRLLFQRLMRAGSNGYLLKNSSTEDLLTAINSIVAKGSSYVSHDMLSGLLDMVLAKGSDTGGKTHLSLREEKVVRMAAAGYTSKVIASEMGLSSKTIDTYRTRAMAKLGLQSRAELVRYGLDHGWSTQMIEQSLHV